MARITRRTDITLDRARAALADVERQIGIKSGTGGSSGAPYLRSRLGLHYFPILWELRSRL